MVNSILLASIQCLIYVLAAPCVIGILRWCKARLQGRKGAWIFQPYLDLWKLFHLRPTFPESASWVFRAAPGIVFGSYVLLGAMVPAAFFPASLPEYIFPTADLIMMMYLLGLPVFVLGLAGMDSGSPLANLGSSREMFMNLLTEPVLVVIFFVLALEKQSFLLVDIIDNYRLNWISGMMEHPSRLLIMLSFLLVILMECGRIPFDNHATHLELTMIGKAIKLEYAGPYLALLEWSEAMRLTFFLTLFINIFVPILLPQIRTGLEVIPALLVYLLKLAVLVIILSGWEMLWAKIRLRQSILPAGIALTLSLVAVALVFLKA